MDPFVAEIRLFGFNFAPTGWATCDGQLLAISQNTALFSLLGTTYGGDGRSTFALPNLEGRAPVHAGNNQPGPGLSSYYLGQEGGVDTVTLIDSENPAHPHQMRADVSDNADAPLPSASSVFAGSTGGALYQTALTPGVQLAPQALALMGGSLPHNNLQPYLTVLFCIALQGVFPQRQ